MLVKLVSLKKPDEEINLVVIVFDSFLEMLALILFILGASYSSLSDDELCLQNK